MQQKPTNCNWTSFSSISMGENLLHTRHILILFLRFFFVVFHQQSCNICYAAKVGGWGCFSNVGAGQVWCGQQRFCNTTHHFYCLSAARKQQQQRRLLKIESKMLKGIPRGRGIRSCFCISEPKNRKMQLTRTQKIEKINLKCALKWRRRLMQLKGQ